MKLSNVARVPSLKFYDKTSKHGKIHDNFFYLMIIQIGPLTLNLIHSFVHLTLFTESLPHARNIQSQLFWSLKFSEEETYYISFISVLLKLQLGNLEQHTFIFSHFWKSQVQMDFIGWRPMYFFFKEKIPVSLPF